LRELRDRAEAGAFVEFAAQSAFAEEAAFGVRGFRDVIGEQEHRVIGMQAQVAGLILNFASGHRPRFYPALRWRNPPVVIMQGEFIELLCSLDGRAPPVDIRDRQRNQIMNWPASALKTGSTLKKPNDQGMNVLRWRMTFSSLHG
jgi:hypothetical protein